MKCKKQNSVFCKSMRCRNKNVKLMLLEIKCWVSGMNERSQVYRRNSYYGQCYLSAFTGLRINELSQ